MSYEPGPDINDILEPRQQIDPDVVIRVMQRGRLSLHGLMPFGSNYTFLVTVSTDDVRFNAIYKPARGERPLWDFEYGSLCKREVASYELSRALGGWPAVPPTVLRKGPHGVGSLQQFVYADYEAHYFNLKDDPSHRRAFEELTLFDYLINNADRKGGHCLLDPDHKIWAIDHGLSFHVEHKLRTVIWEFENQPIPSELLADLEALCPKLQPGHKVHDNLSTLITPIEIEYCQYRLETLLDDGRFPCATGYRDYPYPPI